MNRGRIGTVQSLIRLPARLLSVRPKLIALPGQPLSYLLAESMLTPAQSRTKESP